MNSEIENPGGKYRPTDPADQPSIQREQGAVDLAREAIEVQGEFVQAW